MGRDKGHKGWLGYSSFLLKRLKKLHSKGDVFTQKFEPHSLELKFDSSSGVLLL